MWSGFTAIARWLASKEELHSSLSLKNPFYDPQLAGHHEGTQDKGDNFEVLQKQYADLYKLWEKHVEQSRTWVQSPTLCLKFLFELVNTSINEREASLERLVNTVAQELNRSFGHRVYGASITRLTEGGERLAIIAGQGLDPLSLRRTFEPGQGFVGSIWRSGKAQYCRDVGQDPRFRGAMRPRGAYKSLIGVPVMDLQGNFFGTIVVEGKESNAFPENEDTERLQLFAHILAIGYVLAGDLPRAQAASEYMDKRETKP